MMGPFDFYLQAWIAGLRSGRPCVVVRVADTHRKCWGLNFLDPEPQCAP
jgi:hypothetical protein